MASLRTSAGDGGLRVELDAFGAFGSSVGSDATNAFYNPIGDIEESGTTFESGVAIRVGSQGTRTFLTSGSIGGSGSLTNPGFTEESQQSATSTFGFANLNFGLTQEVIPIFNEQVRTGSTLVQTYTITNPTTDTVNFELIRYLDGDLGFDGSISDSGGRLVSGGEEIIFQTDSGDNPLASTTFVGITANGGSTTEPGRYEIDSYSGLLNRIINGTPLDDTVTGDGPDEDQFIDGFPYDVTVALRNGFTLEAGQSTTYTTTTIFGSGSPEDVVTTVPDRIPNTIPTAKNLSILNGTQVFRDFIGGVDANDFFRFELNNKSSFNLALNGLSADADVAILNSRGVQIESVSVGEGSDGLINRDLDAGTYYLRVFRFEADTTPYNLEVSAIPEPPPFQIRSVNPQNGSSAGATTITIEGNQFTAEAEVTLIDNAGNELTATNVTWLNSETLSATFDLTGVEVDAYDVRVSDTPGTATAEDVFDVNTGFAGQLELYVSSPSRIRSFGTDVVTVTYRNDGDTDITAPLLRLEAEGASFRLPGEQEFTDNEIQFLGINNEGLAGVLPPGASGSFQIEFRPTASVGERIDFTVNTVAADESVDWDSLKDSLRPSYISIEAWDAIYENFTASVGDTAGEYQAVLAQNASYISRLGEYTNDASRLLGFELQQASDYQSLSQRYNIGSFGRGRSFVGDIRLVTDEDSNITIENSGTQRFFELQADGTYRTQTGNAELIQDGDRYRLREQDSTVTAFKSDGSLDFFEDSNGNRITAGYTDNQLTSLVSSNGESLTFTYNNQGRIASITDQTGQTTNYSYNDSGELLLSVTDATGTTSYSYNDDFAITSITDANGTQALFEYDDQGRLIQESFNDGTEALTYSYDENGSVTIADSTGATTQHLLNDRGAS